MSLSFRPRLEALEIRAVPTAVVFLTYPNSQLSPEVKARIKEVMQEEFDDAGADILVTDDPLVGENAVKVVTFLNNFSTDFGGGSRWGDADLGGRNARVYVKEFTDDANVSGEFNTTEKLGNAIGETGAHEVGHTFGCNHNNDEPNTKMTHGGRVTPEERAKGGRMFNKEDAEVLRRNAGAAGPPGPLLPHGQQTFQVVVNNVPQPEEAKQEDESHMDALLSFGGQLCANFYLGYVIQGLNGVKEFFARTSLQFAVASEFITLFHQDAMQWAIEGRPGTPFAGQMFTSEDAIQFDLSDPVMNPQISRDVFRKLDMGWDVNGNGAADVFFSLDADANHPGSMSGFLNPSFAELNPIVTGVGQGGGPHVKVFDPITGELRAEFLAYGPNVRTGVIVATGDINGDGIPDTLTGPGRGAAPHVKVFDGVTGAEIKSFFAFGSGFLGGVNLAAGDIDRDGFRDIIVGAGPGGGPHVVVFDGRTGEPIKSFFAYTAGFDGGVTVAATDVNGDGFDDIITGTGPGNAPHVKVFSGFDGKELKSFFAFAPTFLAGLNVAGGDLNGDGFGDIITGANTGGGPHVKGFNGRTGAELFSFFAFPGEFGGGVRVGAADVNGDGRPDVVTAGGPGGTPEVRTFDGLSVAQLDSFFAYDSSFLGGVYVGTGR